MIFTINYSRIRLFLAGVAILTAGLLAGCDALDDSSSSSSSGNNATLPSGLAGFCDSLTDGGTLSVNAGSRSASIEPGECYGYTFIGDPSTTYTVTLTTNAGNADLIVAFNDSYSSQVSGSPSTNSGTFADSVTFESFVSQEYYVAIYATFESSTFAVEVQSGSSGGGGTTGDGSGGTTVADCNFGIQTFDSAPFGVVQTIPTTSAANVDPNSSIIVFFDDVIDGSTVNSSTFVVSGSGLSGSGSFQCASSESGNSIITFTPSSSFSSGSSVTVTLPTNGILDDDGNGIFSEYSFSFTVGSGSGTSASDTDLDFEGGSIPSGVICAGDCAVLSSFGDAPPIGAYAAYISSGDATVSSEFAIDGTTSILTISNVSPSVSSLTFSYNFISEEFDEFVGSEFDDVFIVTVAGPNGSIVEIITSVNTIGTVSSTAGTFPNMFDAQETGNQSASLDISSLGSPLTIAFIVSDVGDSIFATVVMVDDISVSGGGGGSGGGSISYITWIGNANGEYVTDATDDFVRFRADTRQMVFGSTTYINTFVDSDAIFFVDSSIIGVIAGVAGTNNTTIAAIVCNNGQIIDLFGFESDLSFTCDTGVFPGYTTPEGLTGMSESYNAGQTSIPAFQLRNTDVGDSNAIIEIDGQAQDGYLTN